MLRAQYEQRGPAPQDLIEAVEFEAPELQSGQVLLEVLAAPINPSDLLTITGEYGSLPPLPAVGGNEGVGRVAQLGPDVERPAVGEMVLLPLGCGTWSTHVVADAARLMVLPRDGDPRQLAMLAINPPTASLLLSEFVDLQPGDWIIQNAANSGVAGYLTQLARIRGLRTVNVVRRESVVQAVRDSVADVVLVDGVDLPKRVAEATHGASIGLGIDAVGGAATGRLAACLGDGATLVNYGAMSGSDCAVSPRAFVFHDIRLRGFWLARWFQSAEPERQLKVFGELSRLIADGELTAKVHATFAVRDIKDAVAVAGAGERDGKVLIVPGD